MQPIGLRADTVGVVHWVIVELDARGEIDSHAAMCLRLAITDAVAVDAAEIIVDLRDVVAIDEDAVAVLSWAHRACRAHGTHLELRLGVRATDDALALVRAGLATPPVADEAERCGAAGGAPVRWPPTRTKRKSIP